MKHDGYGVSEVLEAAMSWVEWERIVSPGTQVFLKPNLTWKVPIAGVTTSPPFIVAIVQLLRSRTARILIGESDGGYHSFDAEESFRSHGLYDLASRYDVEVVNLSTLPSEKVTTSVAGHEVSVELPSRLLHDVDVFITLPVPKVHAMTRVSLGFKNQWGCLPQTMRLRNHPEFSRKVLAINRILRPRLVVFDGGHFLDRTGPMIGDPVRMDLVIASNDVGAGSLVCCEIMGLDPYRVPHLRLAQQEGMMPLSVKEVTLNQSLGPFKTHRFQLRRSMINYIALAAFHSHLGTRLFYDSAAAGPIHRVLYAIRKNRLIARLLYGSVGPPAAEGRHY